MTTSSVKAQYDGGYDGGYSSFDGGYDGGYGGSDGGYGGSDGGYNDGCYGPCGGGPITLSGYVFEDKDSSGNVSTGDDPLYLEWVEIYRDAYTVPAWTEITSTDENGNPTGFVDHPAQSFPEQVFYSAQTDAIGHYSIVGITSGTYKVRHARNPLWAGWVRTTANGVSMNLNMNRYLSFGVKNNQPPLAPTPNPVVIGCSGNQAQTTFSWTSPANANTTSYDIWRSDSGGTMTLIAQVPFAQKQFTDNAPENNQHYWYHVYAVGTNGSTYGGNVYGPSDNCTPPTFSFTPGCQLSGNGPKFDLAFSTTTPNISGYNIWRQRNGDPGYTQLTPPSSQTYFTSSPYEDTTSVLGDTEYRYVIASIGIAGKSSPSTNTTVAYARTGWCDTTPPTLNFSPLSLNGVDPNGCFDETMITNGTPRAMDVVIQDPPPPTPPSGIDGATVQIRLINTTSGADIIPWTVVGVSQQNANTWRYMLQRATLTVGGRYTLEIRANDRAGRTGQTSYTFVFRRSCADWIQTTGGNVHTEGNINVPGGP